MALNWKRWLGIEHLVDASDMLEDEAGRVASAGFIVDGSPRFINQEAIAAARAANEAYQVPVHELAALAHPRRQSRVFEGTPEQVVESGSTRLSLSKEQIVSALPVVAAIGLARVAGPKLLKILWVEREEPLWALKDLEKKNLESYGDSELLHLLPEEVLLAVTSKLGIADRLRLASTCRKFYHISTLPAIWASVDLSGSGSAVERISDKALWRLVKRSCGGAELADDVTREPPRLKARVWRDEVLKDEAVIAPPNGTVQGGANGPPAGIILAPINQLRNQQGQALTAPALVAPPSDTTVIDSTWRYTNGAEETKDTLGWGDALSTTLPLQYLDVRGCSKISRDCLTSIIAQSASSLRQIKASGACQFDRKGVDLIVQYGIEAEVDVELENPNKVEWRMLLLNLRGEKDQNLVIKRLLLKVLLGFQDVLQNLRLTRLQSLLSSTSLLGIEHAPLLRIGPSWKVLFQMSILHNLHLAELHLDRCVLRPSEALTVLEAVQHNVGLSALRISRAAEGVFQNVPTVHTALSAMLQENTTLRSLIIDETKIDDDCVKAITHGIVLQKTLTCLGLSRIRTPAFEDLCTELGPGGALRSIRDLRLTGSKLPCQILLEYAPFFQKSSRMIQYLELDVNTSCAGHCISALSRTLDGNVKLHHLRLTVHYGEMSRASASALMRLMRRHGKRVTVQTPAPNGYETVGLNDLRLATLDRAYKENRPRFLFALFAFACAKLTFAAGS